MSIYKFGNDLTKIRENKKLARKTWHFYLESAAGPYLE